MKNTTHVVPLGLNTTTHGDSTHEPKPVEAMAVLLMMTMMVSPDVINKRMTIIVGSR